MSKQMFSIKPVKLLLSLILAILQSLLQTLNSSKSVFRLIIFDFTKKERKFDFKSTFEQSDICLVLWKVK